MKWSKLSSTSQGATAMMLSHGLRLGLSLVLMLACARILGPEHFGLYSTLIALVWIFQGLISFGIQTPLSQFLVKENHAEAQWLGGAFLLHFGLCLLGMGAYLSLLFYQYSDSAEAILGGLILAPVLFFPLAENFNQALVAKQRTTLSALAGISAFLLASLLMGYALLQGSFKTCLLAFSAEFVLLGILLVLLHLRSGGALPQIESAGPKARRLLLASYPLFLAIGVQLLHQRISIILLERLSGAEEAGVYAAAQRICALVSTLMIILTTPFFASLSRDYYHRPEQYPSTLRKQLDTQALLALIACIVLISLGPWMMVHLLGPQYLGASELILPLGISAYLFCLRPMYDRVINLWEKPWQETLSYGLLLVSLALFSALLIPLWGAIGAAWAFCLSIVVGQYLGLLCTRDGRRFLLLQVQALVYPLRRALGRADAPLSALRREMDS